LNLTKNFEPAATENRWYTAWMENSCFVADPSAPGEPYCITIPPPNITGSLHMGHALNNTVLDTMTRWHRMRGFNALCLPGTDHASIATQNVVEREIAKEGLTRDDLGREQFIQRCWQWREVYGSRIYMQLQKLGCSYDWSRARFTMDDTYVEAIHEEFMRWWDRGLIYRGARVVNWCPRCRSAISDIEVDTETRTGRLYHLRYPFADGSGFVTIATTRPETMLGDVAVAANPADERYRDLFGRMLRLPLVNREIPLIADDYAKMEFGTGAVKVTPAHDLNDFECGIRNRLPSITVIAEDGTMNAEAGAYAGLDRFEARTRILADLEELGAVVKIEDHAINTPLCDRCKTVIEPLLSEQWFVKQDELAKPAVDAVKEGRIKFVPERYTRIYLDWMEKIQPWCISRQLWWGHRIPVWWTADGRYSAGRNAEEAAQRLGVSPDELKQDEDALDTWFSSALWPHATLGWPRQTEDLAKWYPTSLLSTAQEILFLWVARMIMTGMDFMGEIPFHHVYVHATVLDENGERMSKSKGNGVDPLDLIEKYGADATRLSLLQQAGKNQDIRFSEERVKQAGSFCTKLWNVGKFVLMNLGEAPPTSLPPHERLTTSDRWILTRLAETAAEVNQHLSTFDMDDAMRSVYAFFWDDLCDWYIEVSKPRLRDENETRDAQSVLRHVFEATLRLLHPMMPFITEELWQALTHSAEEQTDTHARFLMFRPYPQAHEFSEDACRDRQAVAAMQQVMDCIRGFRNLRAELGLPPGQRLPALVVSTNRRTAEVLTDNTETIVNMAKLAELAMADTAPPTESGTWVSTPVSGADIYLEIGDALDIPKERERITRELSKLEAELAAAEGRLGNPQFVERAPQAVVEKERANVASLQEKRLKLTTRRGMLGIPE
jgi:valyl-tRNA synthetase